MIISVHANGLNTKFRGAQFLTIKDGKQIWFRGREKTNAVFVDLSNKTVEIELIIHDGLGVTCPLEVYEQEIE